MQIEQIRAKRFKSLYDLTIPLNQLTVLTGPNGSGKSNFAAAIDFLGETYRFGLEFAVGRAGGIDGIAHRRKRRTTVAIELGIVVRFSLADLRSSNYASGILNEDQSLWLEHSFGIRPSKDVGDSTFSIANESIRLHRGDEVDRQLLLSIGTAKSGEDQEADVYISDDLFPDTSLGRSYKRRSVTLQQDVAEPSYPTDLLIHTSVIPSPIIREIRTLLSRLRVYRLNASACRRAGVLTPSAALESDGGNLPGVIARLRRRPNAASWRLMFDSMSEIFADLSDIQTTVSASSGLDLRFHEAGVGRPWSAYEVSDGTIQYLAMLAVLFDRTAPTLVIEEPENALHSWLLRQFLEKSRENTARQVLLTTHSPTQVRPSTR